MQNAAVLAGLIFVVMGILGFAVGGFEGFAAPRGRILVAFQVNPLQNTLHLFIGGFLIRKAASSSDAARRAALAGAVILGGLAAVGFLVFRGAETANILAANSAVNWLHLLSALLLAHVLMSRKNSQAGAVAGSRFAVVAALQGLASSPKDLDVEGGDEASRDQ